MMKTINVPKSQIARDKILDWIRDGRITAGEKLPSERELAKSFGINHQTIRKGISELEREGLIERKYRIGNFLREVAPIELTKGMALILPGFMLTSEETLHNTLTNLYLRGVLATLDQRKYSLSILGYRPNQLWLDVGEILRTRGINGVILQPSASVDVEEQAKQGVEMMKTLVRGQELSESAVVLTCKLIKGKTT